MNRLHKRRLLLLVRVAFAAVATADATSLQSGARAEPRERFPGRDNKLAFYDLCPREEASAS